MWIPQVLTMRSHSSQTPCGFNFNVGAFLAILSLFLRLFGETLLVPLGSIIHFVSFMDSSVSLTEEDDTQPKL